MGVLAVCLGDGHYTNGLAPSPVPFFPSPFSEGVNYVIAKGAEASLMTSAPRVRDGQKIIQLC